MKVCVIGLGRVGLTTAKYVLSKGHDVWGHDASQIAVDKAPNEGISSASSDWSLVPSADVYLVCVSTRSENGRSGLSSVFDKKVSLLHVPQRYWALDEVNHGVRQLRVMGAIDKDSLNAGLEFYRDMLDIPVHAVSSIEVAGLCKISENAHRYVEIAFAEQLKMIAGEIGFR